MPVDTILEGEGSKVFKSHGSNKKEQTDNKHNIDGSQKHYTKWKQPETKEYIPYDSICINF